MSDPIYIEGENLKFKTYDAWGNEIVVPKCVGTLIWEEMPPFYYNNEGKRHYCANLSTIKIELQTNMAIMTPTKEKKEEMGINKSKKWVHVVVHAYGEKRILLETDIHTDLDEDTFCRLYRLIRAELKIIKEYEEPLYLAKAIIQAMQERRYINSNMMDETWHIENAGCKS